MMNGIYAQSNTKFSQKKLRIVVMAIGFYFIQRGGVTWNRNYEKFFLTCRASTLCEESIQNRGKRGG